MKRLREDNLFGDKGFTQEDWKPGMRGYAGGSFRPESSAGEKMGGGFGPSKVPP